MRGTVRGFPFFDLEKELPLSYILSELSQEVEIWYVNLIGAL